MSPRRFPRASSPQRGFTLIEVLVSLLVFAFGVLGLVGLQATAIRFATDAQQRADATFLADQMLGRMLISDPTTIASFAHRPAEGPMCAPTGTASANVAVDEWLDEVAALLPGAIANAQRVTVDAGTGQVTIALCWQSPGASPHQLVVSNQVQWQ